ncbi:50S ribosomal protein L23 [Porphyromonadaceae bacterium COT-184 OH4590]|nr:50S ribosomal protein L23 [Porphyromonadaceae bacterium COT-184 OH4590]MDO4726264.1 50S ribosomal protein L23 [Porphyromonadaceae bacterium]
MSIIIKPIVTEKMTKIGEKFNRVAFRVSRDANKVEIKKAVEALYNVTVKDVNTIQVKGKHKSRYTKAGLIEGTTPFYKKAIITLAEGSNIDFYSNI